MNDARKSELRKWVRKSDKRVAGLVYCQNLYVIAVDDRQLINFVNFSSYNFIFVNNFREHASVCACEMWISLHSVRIQSIL